MNELNDGNSIEFYSLKKRAHVRLPYADTTKTITKRQTKSGTQQRYKVEGVDEGTRVNRFVTKAVYDSLVDVREV